jgi:hypothetical protein
VPLRQLSPQVKKEFFANRERGFENPLFFFLMPNNPHTHKDYSILSRILDIRFYTPGLGRGVQCGEDISGM